MSLLEWFQKGLTYEEYKAQMKVNEAEMNRIYRQFQLGDEEKKELASLKGFVSKAIVLTEDWCGDALMNNPILMNIAEELRLDIRFILRDSNLELMDQYLTNGTARSIPIFIFMDNEGTEKCVWGPRAVEVQNFVDVLRTELPEKEAEDFEEKQKEMYRKIKETYLQDQQLWKAVSKSIITKLKNEK